MGISTQMPIFSFANIKTLNVLMKGNSRPEVYKVEGWMVKVIKYNMFKLSIMS